MYVLEKGAYLVPHGLFLNHEVLFMPRTKGGVKEKVNNGVGEMTLILFYTSRGRLWTVSSEQ